MRPRSQRRRITCAKQDRFPQQTTWRDCFASCLKGYIYIYVQNTLNGIVVKTLQCWVFVWECGTSWISYMSDSRSLSPPSGLRIKMLGLPCNQRVVSQKSQKSCTCAHVNETLTLFSRNLVMKNCARRVSLKRIGTLFPLISLKLDQIDLNCLVHHIKEETISSVPCHSLMPLDNNYS